MSYIEITKRQFGATGMPDNLLRVNKGSLTLSGNIAKNYMSSRETLESGREKLKFGISIDTERMRIKLDPRSVNGFVFARAHTGEGEAMISAKGSGFKRSPMPTGDYVLVDGKDLEFELAR